MLRYLDNCNEVKVGITELQERVEVPEQIGTIQQVARQAMNGDGQNIFLKYSGKTKENYLWPAGPDGKRSGKAQSTWKEGVKTPAARYKCLTKDKIFSGLRSKASSECKTERLKDCKIKSLKK